MGQSQISQQRDHSARLSVDSHHPARKLNTNVSYIIMPGYHFTKNVLYCPEEEQFYRHYGTSQKCHTYICRESGCKCKVFIQHNQECYIGNEMMHNHESKRAKYLNLRALNEMKFTLHSADNQLSAKEVFDDVIKR